MRRPWMNSPLRVGAMGWRGGGYWYRSLREPVQFQSAVQTLAASGHRIFIEVSPHPVLTTAVEDTLTGTSASIIAATSSSPSPTRSSLTSSSLTSSSSSSAAGAGAGAGSGVVVTGTLRRDDGGLGRLAASLAQVWVAGGGVDWSRWFPGPRSRVDLPTYAFQRRRYWPGRPAVGGDPAGLGLGGGGHPLLGAAVELPGTGGVVLTGRLSLATHPWLADHQVAGTVLLPGAAFAELVVRAGDEAGCGLVEELVLQAPLVLPARGGVQVRVSVSGPSDDGRRTAEVHSRGDDAGAGEPWTLHGAGTLTAGPAPVPSFDLAAWPPPGAEPADVAGLYDVLAGRGLAYGPAFRGLVAGWRRGEEVFAEAALPEAVPADSYGLHPALLDAALHAIALGSFAGNSGEGPMLPFAWSGVALHAAGAAAVRVRLAPTAGGITVQVADPAGMPVASVESLAIRPADPAALTAAGGGQQWLFSVDWQPHDMAAVPGGAGSEIVVLGDGGLATLPEAPAVVVAACPAPDGPVPAAVRTAVDDVLDLVQAWVAEDRFAGSQLGIVARGAGAARAGEAAADLAGAAVWGLVASAQAEHPGQVMLADTDTGLDERVLTLIGDAASAGEPRLAIRGGQGLVPRLARAGRQDVLAGPAGRGWRGGGTGPGGTGALGALTALHLVIAHHVRHLIRVSRRGGAAPGAAALAADLARRGARVTVAACDVGERQALEGLLASIPAEHALTGVVHAAGVLDDALVGSLSAERADGVLAAKADAAWYLHELTRDLDLGMFVLFSSAAGVLGSPGQGSYAAANAFLDALAGYRQARGLAGVSVAWGLWEAASEMVGQLAARVVARGVRALPSAKAQALLDAALERGQPTGVAGPL